VSRMLKAKEMTKKKYMANHARTMLVVVFRCNSKKSPSKKLLLKELVNEMEKKHPDKIDDYIAPLETTTIGTMVMPTMSDRTKNRVLQNHYSMPTHVLNRSS